MHFTPCKGIIYVPSIIDLFAICFEFPNLRSQDHSISFLKSFDNSDNGIPNT